MTPEKEIETIVRNVCPDSGHWPYTRDSALYVGYRPGPETPEIAGNRIIRMHVRYDLAIVSRRGPMAYEMEKLRYKLYAALYAGGWKFETEPGPETYDARAGQFLWPISVIKGFALDAGGLPEDPRMLRNSGGET